MSGFVYIWQDKKHKRYYIGSHWGKENDGYICSSPSMREAYRRRSYDFKRRIISTITTNRIDLLNEEQRWLNMINKEDFGNKYYNINDKAFCLSWWVNKETRKQVGQKISKTQTGRKQNKKSIEKNRQAQLLRVKNGTHNFTSEFNKNVAKTRIENGTHNFLNGVATKRQFELGLNASQKEHKCPHCKKVGKGTLMFYYHFDNCKLVRTKEQNNLISNNAKNNRKKANLGRNKNGQWIKAT